MEENLPEVSAPLCRPTIASQAQRQAFSFPTDLDYVQASPTILFRTLTRIEWRLPEPKSAEARSLQSLPNGVRSW
jgi:hypothetical protein